MNIDWFKSFVKFLFSNPGINWCLIFNKNSFKNKELKFEIVDPAKWSEDSVFENTNCSESVGEI